MRHALCGPTGPSRRRWLIQAGAAAVLVLTGLRPACAGMGISSYTVPLVALQAMLSERFPRRFPLAGLATLELQAPLLVLRPEANRLRARVPAVLSGPAVDTPGQGMLEVEFGLRYEPRDHTLRAHDIALQSLEIEGLDPAVAALLHAWAPRLARRALGEVVLHRLEPKDLALLDGLGLQPGPITVTEQGLAIAFVRRAPEPVK
ncbi:DUF1439 domain-containing protein [Simplicispira hankyongi]|uniref:DUF1439 domain-containing protein n=1 Tax=Simplicispira hankyongi TaxID=2315688 RepID=A0A398C9Z8_9BURK|nr:DUF1439 domain-containing protein [Simplicispira hankyongi]RID97668.1 DUF1439 domain-containing protein [Simplicispira hankyongi]